MAITFEALAQTLLGDAAAIVKTWYPNGRREGREWCVGDVYGQRGDSLKINIDSGKWKDFATGEYGKDLVSLYAAQHGITQGEAALRISGQTPSSVPRLTNGHTPPEPVAPSSERPPADSSLELSRFRHGRHGVPHQVYAYRDIDGTLLSVVARYETASGKEFCPFTWREGRWRMKGPDKPRPLYGLERLAGRPRRVVLVEGEKAADALQSIVQGSPILTWPSGAVNWRYADWEPLRGRSVLLWPDADPPGIEAMRGIAERLLPLGCTLSVVETEGLPDGFDAADLVAQQIRGAALTAWLRERTKPIVTLQESAPLQRVQAPGPVPLTGELLEQETAGESERVPSYALAREFGLKVSRRGPHINLANTTLLIRQLVGREQVKPLWWDSFLKQVRHAGGEWEDHDTYGLLTQLQHDYPFETLTSSTLDQAITLYAYQNPRNCAQEWLRGLQWDGEPRLDYLLEDGFGCARTEYTMAVGRCFLMGIVARVMMPGCQVDTLPVFEGAQGIYKSQALRILGGPWFAETTEPVTNKDFYLCLTGKMLVEIADFSSFRKGNVDEIKAVITRATDRYRLPYGKRPADHARSCVFSATANDHEWSQDPTGARRYWPVRCGTINLEYLRGAREQLFAEAYALVMKVPSGCDPPTRLESGAAWWDVPESDARSEQKDRFQEDAIAPAMRPYVVSARGPFSTLNVLQQALNLDAPACFDHRLQQRVKAQLVHWGFKQIKMEGVKVWVKG